MENGKNFLKSYPGNLVFFTAAVMGNTSSAPTLPTDGTFTDAAAGLFPTRLNSVDRTTAGAPTHVGTGIITITYRHVLKNVVPLSCQIVSDGASPTTALYGIISKVTPGTRTVTVRIYTPAGTLTDPGTSDLVIVNLVGFDTTG